MRVIIIILVALLTVGVLTFFSKANAKMPDDKFIQPTFSDATGEWTDTYISDCLKAWEFGKQYYEETDDLSKSGFGIFVTHWLLFQGKIYKFIITISNSETFDAFRKKYPKSDSKSKLRPSLNCQKLELIYD